MLTNKLIVYTIVACFSILGLGSISINADDITVDKLIGQWYTIATVHPLNDEVLLRCDRREVTKGSDANTVNIVDSTVTLDGKYSYKGTGQIKNSALHVKYPEFGPEYEEVHPYDCYNNGEELIYHDQSDPKSLALHSRKPIASDEVKAAFKKEAAKINAEVTYIDQKDC